jgi:hypothetical protein
VNSSKVTKSGLEGAGPGREALPGAKRPARQAGAGRRRRRGDEDRPRSYYGLPVLNKPVWEARDIAGYLFLGVLAGASSLVALGAQVTGRPQLARGARAGAAGAAALSLAALVNDLRPHAQSTDQGREDLPETPRPGRKQGKVGQDRQRGGRQLPHPGGRKGGKSGSYDDCGQLR